MSEPQVDTSFLKGVSKEKLTELVKTNDPRMQKVLNDPNLKKELLAGKLTAPDEPPKTDTPAPAAPVAVAEQAPAPAAATSAPANKLDEEAQKRGFKSYEAMIKNFDDTKEYIKVLERSRDELNARAGAEGGPLGQKVKDLTAHIQSLEQQLVEVKRKPEPVPELTNREIIELYEPDFTDKLNPEEVADPVMAKALNKQQAELAKFIRDLKTKVNKLSPGVFQKKLEDVMRQNEELQKKYDMLSAKEEMRDAKYHSDESQNSFNSIYGEADAFLNKIGLKTTRPFAEIDKSIANSGDAGSETRNLFLKSLPETDRNAWELAIPLINRYGKVNEVPVNGGKSKTVRFEKYGNVDSLEDLYNLELLKSGKLDAVKRDEILAAHRQGAQSVIESAKMPPGVKGLPDTAAQGETLPTEATLDDKAKRIRELTLMGPALMKDKKLFDEFKSLKADVYRNVRTQMAQGTFKRKR